MLAAARFAAGLAGHPEINLLPYHNLGQSKYEMIGRDYDLPELENRKSRDPYLVHLRELCCQAAPENRVSIGGDAIALT